MGNNMLAAPGAKMDDGFLDVSIYDHMGEGALVKHFLAASANKPDALAVYRARHVRITTETAVLAREDTDPVSERTVVEIDVVPAALAIIVGNGIGLTIPVEAAPAAPTFAPAPPSTNGSPKPELQEHTTSQG
jgi:diacylglycerol kinase family enzyme